MCGRFTNIGRAILLAHRLGLMPASLQKRYNIAPTQYAPVALRDGAAARFEELFWGLVPSWSRDASMAARCINARAESVADKPVFREAFRQRRCLVPASGFYEWRREPDGKTRTPFYFSPAEEGSELAFAGLWECWRGDGEELRSFTIVTTEASRDVLPVHERMPVILPAETWEQWLDPGERRTERLLQLLRPASPGVLRSRQVGMYVNNARNEGCKCLEAATDTGGESARSGVLF